MSQGDRGRASDSVQGRDVIMMLVVEEEMHRGWMERTWPSGNGQDLGTRERWGSTMVHQEGPTVTQPRQSGSRAGWKGGG